MKSREEIIEELIKDLEPKEKPKLRLFLRGKGNLTGDDIPKYVELLSNYNKQIKENDCFNEFLKESRKPY